jgi:hypothetical protein
MSSLGELEGFYSYLVNSFLEHLEIAMKFVITLFLIAQAVLLVRGASAQAIYGPTGNYLGYSQTSPSGVTNVYNGTGQNVQSYQVDHGQTNFYSPAGAYQGTSTTPVYAAPNTSINTPRQAPVAPSVKGW